MKSAILKSGRFLARVASGMWLATAALAAAPGITGPTFNLTAQPAFLNQPDGESVYSWGYGCNGAPTGFAPTLPNQTCNTMQVPGPTMIVTEGQTVTVNLINQLPTPAGNTSILFPGFAVTATGGVTGLLTNEAAPAGCTPAATCGTVTYTFVASSPGTHAYYSGTQGDLQIEMGMYGAIIVLPSTVPANCNSGYHALNTTARGDHLETDFRLAHAANDHPGSCYDREYLFQWAEMDTRIHAQALAQVTALTGCTAGAVGCSLSVQTEPYHPAYFLINGRSMPDLMDPNFAGEYPHQPYNANPHMHLGELTLIRTIGQGRMQHPFHEHANHVRILARDGNLVLSGSTAPVTYTSGLTGDAGVAGRGLAGLLMFNTDTTPGESFDGIFYFTGRGLNWDPYGHHPGDTADPLASLSCTPDVNGYNSGGGSTTAAAVGAINFMEWCQDHNKPIQVNPFGDVPAGGPATLPDPNAFTNGAWYGGTPYLGPDATLRASMPACAGNPYGTIPGVGTSGPNPVNANCTTLQPANLQLNPANERGWAFMWHSHNEREITTNNVFPGGMLMMMLVDSREFVIDEGM